MSTGWVICEEQNGPQLKKYEQVSFQWCINTDASAMTVTIDDVKTTPNYGWNPVRWLFKRPKFWDVRYEFTIMPQDAPEWPTNASSDCVTTEPDIELTTHQRASSDASGGNS